MMGAEVPLRNTHLLFFGFDFGGSIRRTDDFDAEPSACDLSDLKGRRRRGLELHHIIECMNYFFCKCYFCTSP
jgi:hypothetical protein